MTRTSLPRPRLKDIATIANISVATASMALANHPRVNDDTKRKVRRIGREIGYEVKTRVPAAEASRLGLLIIGGEVQDTVNNPLILELSQAGDACNARFEFAALPAQANDDQIHARAMELARHLDGLLLVGLIDRQVLKRLIQTGLNIVVMGNVLGHLVSLPGVTVVAFDTLMMGYLATSHLLEQGRRRVAFTCEKIYPGLNHDRWYKGYQLAHCEHGLQPDPSLTVVTGQVDLGAGPTAEKFVAMAQPPDGYVVPDRRIAQSLVAKMALRGVPIPLDAMVFDSLQGEQLGKELIGRPHLASPINHLARQSVEQLQALCMNPSAPARHVFVAFESHLEEGDIRGRDRESKTEVLPSFDQ